MLYDYSRAVYVQVAEFIRESILSGEYPEGEKIPSSGELAEIYETSRQTVLLAVKELRFEGYLDSQIGHTINVIDGARLGVKAWILKLLNERDVPKIVKTARLLEMTQTELIGLLKAEFEKPEPEKSS